MANNTTTIVFIESATFTFLRRPIANNKVRRAPAKAKTVTNIKVLRLSLVIVGATSSVASSVFSGTNTSRVSSTVPSEDTKETLATGCLHSLVDTSFTSAISSVKTVWIGLTQTAPAASVTDTRAVTSPPKSVPAP